MSACLSFFLLFILQRLKNVHYLLQVLSFLERIGHQLEQLSKWVSAWVCLDRPVKCDFLLSKAHLTASEANGAHIHYVGFKEQKHMPSFNYLPSRGEKSKFGTAVLHIYVQRLLCVGDYLLPVYPTGMPTQVSLSTKHKEMIHRVVNACTQLSYSLLYLQHQGQCLVCTQYLENSCL